MANEAPAWERRDDETDKAFAAFRIYRDLDARERSIEKTREILGRDPGYTRWLETWSSKYDWVKRVHAYDKHLDNQARKEIEREKIRNRKRRIRGQELLLDLAIQALEEASPEGKYEEVRDEDGNLIEVKTLQEPWSPHEIIRALKEASIQLRRDYDDEPDRRTQEDGEGEGRGNIEKLADAIREARDEDEFAAYDREMEEGYD